MACLRVTVESILSAHACKQSNIQANNWIGFNKIDRKNCRYPKEILKPSAKNIMDTLHNFGAHPNYMSLITQGYFPGIIFNEENKAEYTFFILRQFHISLLVTGRLLRYLLNKKSELRKEFPETASIYNDITTIAKDIGQRLKVELKNIMH